MEDDELPATQPVLPSLLKGVVGYVEVRSGHDNRSRGVISELKSLGASISTTLSKDVTHVVFQGGHVSTYKKARQMCHVVAVSWIEASKDLGFRAPEGEHPPPGYEKYEDPEAARRIKVFKSMQPDFDNEKDDERLNKILERIKRKGTKRPSRAADDTNRTSDTPGKKKKKYSCDRKSEKCNLSAFSKSLDSFDGENRRKSGRLEKRGTRSVSNSPSEIGSTSKRKRRSGKRVKLFTHCGDVTRVASSETITVENGVMDYKKKLPKQSNIADKEKNGIKLPAQENSTDTPNKSFDFAVPKPVENRRGSSARKQKTAMPSSVNNSFVQTGKKSVAPPELLAPPERNETPPPSSNRDGIDSRSLQARPLVFIENIPRDNPAINNKKIDESPQVVTSARQTRKSSVLAGPLMQIQSKEGGKDLSPDTSQITNPFVTRVLEALSSRKKPKVFLKSPWRRQTGPTVERRQSPRLKAQQKENRSVSNSGESDDGDGSSFSADVAQTKRTEPQPKVGFASASAHLFKMLKTKPRKMNSPDAVLLDISYGPAKLSQGGDRERRGSNPDASSVKCNSTSVTRIAEDAKSPLETLNGGLTDEDRSDSPILGTRVKHRLHSSVLSSSRTSTKTPSGVTPLGPSVSTQTQGGVAPTADLSERTEIMKATKQPKVKEKNEQVLLNKGRVSEPEGNGLETEKKSSGDSTDSTRPSRKRSGSGRVERVPSSSHTLTKTPSGVTPLRRRVSPQTQGGIASTADLSERTEIMKTSKQPKIKEKIEQHLLNECRVSEPEGNGLDTEKKSGGDSTDSSTRLSRKRSGSGRVERLPTLVCTYLNESDVKRVMKAVRDLGKFEFEEQVSERTTHLVASGPRRTINMLRAVCRGCWILRDEWVYQSAKAGRWLPEEVFELTEFSPMVRERRMLRLSQSGLGQWDLLSSVGPIFVSPASQPHPPDLKDLILLSGGSVAKSVEKAAVVIRPPTKSTSKKSVKPQVEPVWLLDCIVKGTELPFSSERTFR